MRKNIALCTLLAGATLPLGATGHALAGGSPAQPATFYVGASAADITPTDLSGIYLGGYGVGPMHPATGVLRHTYARAIAIGDQPWPAGNQVVISSVDSQGHFIAYQQGAFGFADMAADLAASLGIPSGNFLFQTTHTHNGYDGIGIWGGVPDSYLAFVKAQVESAVTSAVKGERAAHLRWATATLAQSYFTTFPNQSSGGDFADYPVDDQLRALQAVDSSTGTVTATLLNLSVHPTVYGPLDRISPDWPGAAATYLEGDMQNMTGSYGYPGSVAVVTSGAVGHTWPGMPGDPAGWNPPADFASSDNAPADQYGGTVAQEAINALATPVYLTDGTVAGVSDDTLAVVNTNPVLAATLADPATLNTPAGGLANPAGGYHIMRSFLPPWGAGEVLYTRTTALRIGDLAVFSAPGEPYPSTHTSLHDLVATPVTFQLGLAQDQLGYVEELGDYAGAAQCSTTDEWFFTISPAFGHDYIERQLAHAQALGFPVTASPTEGLDPGSAPPATYCTTQQLP
jgi:hypothetical protein